MSSPNKKQASSSSNLYSKMIQQYITDNKNNSTAPAIEPKIYQISSQIINQQEAEEVTNNMREYHIKSTFTHSHHPDLLKFKQTAHGNRFILCRDEKRGKSQASKSKVQVTKQQQSEKSQKLDSGKNQQKSQILYDQDDLAAAEQRALNQSIKDIGIRYFDKRVNPQLKCFHCKKVGHQAKSCPNQYQSRIICSSCGSNQHVALQCPIKLICFKCGKPGHKITECKQRGVKMCRRCGKGGHDQKICLLFISQNQVKQAKSAKQVDSDRGGSNQRPAVNQNDLLVCQIEQPLQDYYVSEDKINNCLYSVELQKDDQIEDDPRNISKLAKLLQKDDFDFDLDFNLTLGMGVRNQAKKREVNIKRKKSEFIPISCPICAGEHDYQVCQSSEGNKNFEKIYKQSPKYHQMSDTKSPKGQYLAMRKSEINNKSREKGLNIFHTIYETDKPYQWKKVNPYKQNSSMLSCKYLP